MLYFLVLLRCKVIIFFFQSQKLSVLFQQIESGYTMDVLCSEKIHEYFNFPSGLPVPEMQNFLCNLNVTELTEEIGGLTQISIDFGHKVIMIFKLNLNALIKLIKFDTNL